MNKALEALQKLRDLVEYLTRIDYVPTDLRNEVKELLIKSYEDSNGLFSQIEEALKRNEPMKVVSIRKEVHIFSANRDIATCPNCGNEFYCDYHINFCGKCGQSLDWSNEND